MDKAWELLFEGKINEAKQLVQAEFCLATCKDYSLLNLMGYIYLYEKKYEDCLEVYKRYLHLAITEKDRENEHIAYHQLAMVYREMNDYQTALSYIEKEREVIEDSFSEDALKSSVNNYEQGYLRFKIGKIEKSIMYMEQSLKQALQTDDLIAQACAYRGLGEIYRKLDSSKSYDYFSHAIKLFDKAGDEIGAEEVRALIDNKKSETK
jgi:tetratricopeptide repeat domain protein